jgi:DNA-binding NarL/FixJ family response regulator
LGVQRPIAVIFLDRNLVFRRLAARLFVRHFAAELVLIAQGDRWPLVGAPVQTPQAILLGLGADALVEQDQMRDLRADFPAAPIVVLGHLAESAYREAALAAGAAAFIAKDALMTELLPVLRKLVCLV